MPTVDPYGYALDPGYFNKAKSTLDQWKAMGKEVPPGMLGELAEAYLGEKDKSQIAREQLGIQKGQLALQQQQTGFEELTGLAKMNKDKAAAEAAGKMDMLKTGGIGAAGAIYAANKGYLPGAGKIIDTAKGIFSPSAATTGAIGADTAGATIPAGEFGEAVGAPSLGASLGAAGGGIAGAAAGSALATSSAEAFAMGLGEEIGAAGVAAAPETGGLSLIAAGAAVLGSWVVSKIFGGGGGGFCIIVTACHGRDSEEVNIAREYRDKHMDQDQLRGYYILADQLVPLMEESQALTEYIATTLVSKIIEYCRWFLGKSNHCSEHAKLVFVEFMNGCKARGKMVPSYTRENGEIF